MKLLTDTLGPFFGVILLIAILVVSLIAWPMNAYRLFKCDFKPSWKGEVIHAVGLFTPTCYITAWSNWDD